MDAMNTTCSVSSEPLETTGTGVSAEGNFNFTLSVMFYSFKKKKEH